MFSFNAFNDEERGVEGAKILTVTSLFNTKTRAFNMNEKKFYFYIQIILFTKAHLDSLEFNLQKDGKRFLRLADTTVSFYIDLPQNYLPDNQLGHKLFESLELSVNHEQVSRKSTALDYSISEVFFQKVMFDDSFVNTSLDVSGSSENKTIS